MTNNKDIMFSRWYDSLEGTKSQGFAYKAWCAGWEAAVLAEREACAKLCEDHLENTMLLTSYPPKSAAAFQILQLIKARGDKHD